MRPKISLFYFYFCISKKKKEYPTALCTDNQAGIKYILDTDKHTHTDTFVSF